MSHNERRKWTPKKKNNRNTYVKNKKQAIQERDVEDEMNRKLYFGFPKNLNIPISNDDLHLTNTITLPISTRPIGFFLQSIFINIMTSLLLKKRHESFISDCSIYAAYRVSLAQLERRLHLAEKYFSLVNQELYLQKVRFLYCGEELEQFNFVPIADLINAVGAFQYNHTKYQFGIPKEQHAYPFNVTYSNLSNVVNELSNSDSDPHIRKYFYDNNPLPGAIWGPRNEEGKEDKSDNRWPLLMNPEMFWPDNNPRQLQEDNVAFSRLYSLSEISKISKINFETEGDKCALVSTYCKNLRNPSFTYTSLENVDWENCRHAEGTLSNFWSSEKLTLDDFKKAINLVGEIPYNKTNHPYGFRAKSYANTMHRQWKNVDYFTICEQYNNNLSLPIPKVLNLKISLVLPVSTRSIGFFLQTIFSRMNTEYNRGPIPRCSVYQAYRVSLAQLELRLLTASCYHLRETGPVKHYFYENMKRNTKNFSPIVNLINAVGKLVYRGIEYNFIIPRDENISPHNVSYYTLQRTVEMLGDPNTDQKIRKEFYDKSPLPGAVWGPLENGKEDKNNEDWPILVNWEDFWPVSSLLDIEELLIEDYEEFFNLMFVADSKTKYFDFFHNSKIDYYNTNGVKSALVSTHCRNIRNQSVVYKQDGSNTVDWKNCHYRIKGTSDKFWSSVPLEPDAMFMGATILVGEIPPNRSDYPYGTRAMSLAKTSYTSSWTSYIQYPITYDYSSSSSD